jgi:DNA-binding HxlR family transcriptional regulator
MVKTEPLCEPYQGLGTTVDILIALLNGKMMASDVRKVADYRTGVSKLRQFLDAGLVNLTIEDSFRHTNWYELTEKGERVAKLLAEAKKIIGEK